MTEKLFDFLNLAFRQRNSIYRVGEIAKTVFNGGFSFKRLSALILAFFEMFASVISDSPVTPAGEELNLDGYSVVFFDDFNGDSLDTDSWEFRHLGKDSGGFNSTSQARIENGNLILTSEYKNGEYGEGWYAADLQLRKKYKQGYFEIRCKCNKSNDFWSAFWLQAEHPYDHVLSNGGIGGAEIDIMESGHKGSGRFVTSTVHCNGYDDDAENLDSRNLGKFKANDITNEYNTFALKWTEDEYIFYINGVESARTSFAKGVSQVEEYVCVSLCIPGTINAVKSEVSEMIVDYVKICQITEAE